MAATLAQQTIWREGTVQHISYTGSSAQLGTPFGAQTYAVRLTSDSACQYIIGNGTFSAAQDNTSPYLPAFWVEFVKVTPGQSIAAIRAATDGNTTATSGTLWVTELTA